MTTATEDTCKVCRISVLALTKELMTGICFRCLKTREG